MPVSRHAAAKLVEEARAHAARGNFANAERAFSKASIWPEAGEDVFLSWCDMHARRGEESEAEDVLRLGLSKLPTSRSLLLAYAELKRAFDLRDDSAKILQHALKSWPDDMEFLGLAASVEAESGRDSLSLYRSIIEVSPNNPQAILGYVTALHHSGRGNDGAEYLARHVRRSPGWFDGLRALGRLRLELGDGGKFADDFEQILKLSPRDPVLWATYLGILATGLKFDEVLQHLDRARSVLGPSTLLSMFEAQALSETGQSDQAEKLFRTLEPIEDQGFVPVRMRSLLRTGRACDAAQLGERFVSQGPANFIWPLLGLAWRAAGDDRWRWLSQHDGTVAAVSLGLSEERLDEIGRFLRRLHETSSQPYDQSLRGGSQTLGNLLDRTDPEIVDLRTAIREGVRRYIDALPPVDRNHPFLRRDRGPFRFAGCWSVRLRDEGFHVPHIHPMGWISSALYLALPEFKPVAGEEVTANRAGWLALGASPPELGLGLEPVKWIEPQVGRLALFPSIMWHETVPFPAGERLSVAFDIVPFR